MEDWRHYGFSNLLKNGHDVLENFHIVLGKNRFFPKFNISTFKTILAASLPGFESEPFELLFAYMIYSVVFLVCSQIATDLENFPIFLAKNRFFPNLKSQLIIPATSLPGFEREPFQLTFAHMIYSVVFLIYSKKFTDLENYVAKFL